MHQDTLTLIGHIHEHGISHRLGLPSVTFIPHMASWFRSIHLTPFGKENDFTRYPPSLLRPSCS
ncbi:hypothetical protein F4782DRAFT_76904 [Xylaria castorea]|nr:hypothetical protein F4782DRAFT_76904 [Xylaria castorea]